MSDKHDSKDEHDDDGHKKKKKHGGHGGGHGGGGHEEGGHHAPHWIVSFADMVILLMSFFVLLLAGGQQKTASNDELLRILASIKVSFGYIPKSNSKDPMDSVVMQLLSMKNRRSGKSILNFTPIPAEDSDNKASKETWHKAKGALGHPILFQSGSYEIPPEAQEKLDEIAGLVRHHYRMIIIQGHCSRDEAKRDRDNGFDLSYRRANALKEALISRGLATARMRLVSCGPHVTASDEVKNAASATEKLGGNTLSSGRFEQRGIVTVGTYFLPEEDVRD